jgi:hypothetical protein
MQTAVLRFHVVISVGAGQPVRIYSVFFSGLVPSTVNVETEGRNGVHLTPAGFFSNSATRYRTLPFYLCSNMSSADSPMANDGSDGAIHPLLLGVVHRMQRTSPAQIVGKGEVHRDRCVNVAIV